MKCQSVERWRRASRFAYRAGLFASCLALQGLGCGAEKSYLADAGFPDMRAALSNADSERLRPGLRAIQSWYGLASRRLYRDDPERLLNALNALTGDFWLEAYGRVTPGGNVRPLAGEEVPRSATITEREVLHVMLADADLVKSVPFLQLVCDGLDGLMRGLDTAAMFHDIGCVTGDCPKSSQVANFYELIGLLGQDPPSPAALTKASKLPKPWDEILTLMTERRADLNQAITDASALGTTIKSVPGPLLRFSAMTEQARLRAQHYAIGGMFRSNLNTLRAGIQTSLGSEVAGELEMQAQMLDGARRQFEGDRDRRIERLRQQVLSGGRAESVALQITENRRLMDAAAAEFSALQASIRKQELLYADTTGRFALLAARSDAHANHELISAPQTLEVSARHARAKEPLAKIDSLAQAVVAPHETVWKLALAAGDIAHVTATGQWSPTCTLRGQTFSPPDSGVLSTYSASSGRTRTAASQIAPDLSHAMAGPEGFTMQWSNERCSMIATEDAYSASDSLSVGARVGAKVEVNGGFQFLGNGAVASASAGIEISSTHGEQTSHAESQQEASSKRASASFVQGLRSPRSPMPDWPVGSLLLVEVARGATSFEGVRNIRVVRQQATVVADSDADLYLLVNDQGGCVIADGSSLTVTISHLRPRSAAIQGFATGLARSVALMRERAPEILAQGGLSPEQMSSLRLEALQSMREAVSGQFIESDEIGGFFTTWLESELALLRLRAQAYDKSKDVAHLQARLALLEDELRLVGDEARILKLIPMRELRNLEISAMTGPIHGLLEFLADHVYPLMRLRYPDALSRLHGNPELAVLVRGLADVSLLDGAEGEGVLELTAKASALTREVARALQAAKRLAPPEARRLPVVALSFPRGAQPNVAEWRRVDDARARLVWEAVDGGAVATFTVRPGDLYGNEMGTTLKCFNAAPVIRSMGLYIEVPDNSGCDGFNTRDRTSSMVVGEVMTFPSERGPEAFHVENGAWRNDAIQLMCGHSLDAVASFRALPEDLKVANGMSPFGTFQISFRFGGDEIQRKLANATGLTLLFDLGSRRLSSSNEMGWLEACQR